MTIDPAQAHEGVTLASLAEEAPSCPLPSRAELDDLRMNLAEELAAATSEWDRAGDAPLRITKGRVRSASLCPAQVLGENVPAELSQEMALGLVCDLAAGQVAVHPGISVGPGWFDRLVSALEQERPDVVALVERMAPDQRAGLLAEIDERCDALPGLLGSLPAHRPTIRERATIEISDARVRLTAEIDISVGQSGQRVLCEVKSGRFGGWVSEELRHYGLVTSLRDVAAPKLGCAVTLADRGVASVPLRIEDLETAARRVIQTTEVLIEVDEAIASGRSPRTTPGEHCRWCPRARVCPDVSDLVSAELEALRPDEWNDDEF